MQGDKNATWVGFIAGSNKEKLFDSHCWDHEMICCGTLGKICFYVKFDKEYYTLKWVKVYCGFALYFQPRIQ